MLPICSPFLAARFSVLAAWCSLIASRCSLLVAVRLLLFAYQSTCSLYIIALLASRCSLQIFSVRRLLHTLGSTLLAFCCWQFVARWSFLAVYCQVQAARFSLFASCFSLPAWLSFFVARRSSFVTRYTSLSECWSLFPNSLITAHR